MSNTTPVMATQLDSANATSVSRFPAKWFPGERRRTASTSEAGNEANRKKRGPQKYPPNQAHQSEYKSTNPITNAIHSTTPCTAGARPFQSEPADGSLRGGTV